MAMDDLPTLDAQLCFALYSALHAVTRAYRPVLAELGLTYPQYLVLLLLWEEGEQSVGNLAARVQLESSTLTPLLKRLESQGMVTRRRNPASERQVIVALTESGRALQTRAGAIPATLLRAAACPPEQLAAMRDGLMQIRDSIDSSLRSTQN